MDKVDDGLFISVDYTGTLDSGEVFDSSEGREPLEVHMGAGRMIPGFERALMGMAVSEKKTFTLNPAEAYGERDENLTREFPRASLPAELDPQIGTLVGLTTPQGQQVPAKIVAVDAEKITIDLNHPLAGENLTFAIEVVGISEQPTQAPTGCACSADDCSACGH